jgi:hypothetical protein
MPILDAVRKLWRAIQEQYGEGLSSPVGDAAGYLDELFAVFPFTSRAERWLRENVRVQILDRGSVAGGGEWHPDRRLVRLYTTQYEAAIHELSHALWHERRRDRVIRDGLVAAVQRLAEDEDPRWGRVHTLARHYVYGIPEQQGFEQGMLLPRAEWGRGGGSQGEWNDWEMFAGLASGCMADIRLLPPYVRRFYTDWFEEIPPGAPSPGAVAVHR